MKNLKTILRYNKLFIILFVFIAIYTIIFTKVIKYQSKYNGSESEFKCNIKKIKIDGDKLTLEVKAKETLIASYYFKSEEEKEELLSNIHYNDEVLLKGTLQVPFNNTIPNNFNYKNYLYNKKIYYTLSIYKIEKLNNNKNVLYKVKDKLFKRIITSNNSDYYLAFILGDKFLLSSDNYNLFQSNGISHLLALSGMHINIILLIINKLLKFLKENKRIIISSITLILFLLLTGIQASLERATIFYILKNINNKFSINLSNIKLLFLCLFIILILNPFMIYDVGLLYSFVVVFSIFYYTDFIKGTYIEKSLKLSLITFLFSVPITINLNYEINISSIFINLIFVPWISIIVYPLSLISFILPILNPLFNICINITNYLNKLLSIFSITINIPKLPIYIIIIYYLLLLLKKKKYYYLLIFIMFSFKLSKKLDDNYYIYYFDVGQGDSSVLISPYQSEVIMIDTGGKLEYNKDIWQEKVKKYNVSDNVIKFLKSIGITKINYLMLSHGDTDHIKDASNIIDKMKVKKVTFNCGSINKLEKSIIDKKVKYNICNNSINTKYFKITNLNRTICDNENDASDVLYLTINNYKLLFMGDASINIEKNILKYYNIKDIDILKVGHHGSKTSSSKLFIDAINLKYSIISVGKNNRYNHPNDSVLQNLQNTKIYRTDIDGTIMIKINNNKHKILTYPPNI